MSIIMTLHNTNLCRAGNGQIMEKGIFHYLPVFDRYFEIPLPGVG